VAGAVPRPLADIYDTDVDDLWEACTNPERLARWIAKVSGDEQMVID
jgi:uncharacterized protein YndB with AHSA1/START domain